MKKNVLIIIVVSILCLLFYQCGVEEEVKDDIKKIETPALKTTIQEGDIIFQTSKSSQSQAIQLATHSKYSHMGIVFENDGKQYVYEAIQPVQFTALDKWIERGENNHYVVKRLKNAGDLLTPDILEKMKLIGKEFKGKKYDIYFQWSDEAIYCSELVWKIYDEALGIEIGELEKLTGFDLSHDAVKEKIKERYGNHIPDNEQFISPAAMFNSDKLITIKNEN